MKIFLWDPLFVRNPCHCWANLEELKHGDIWCSLLRWEQPASGNICCLFSKRKEGGGSCSLVASNWMLRKADICVRRVETTLDFVIWVKFTLLWKRVVSPTCSLSSTTPEQMLLILKAYQTNRGGDCVVLVGEEFPSSLFFADEEGGFLSSHCGMQQTSSVDTHRLVTFSWKRTWFYILFSPQKVSRQENSFNGHVFEVGVQQIKVADISHVTLVIVVKDSETLCEGNES